MKEIDCKVRAMGGWRLYKSAHLQTFAICPGVLFSLENCGISHIESSVSDWSSEETVPQAKVLVKKHFGTKGSSSAF